MFTYHGRKFHWSFRKFFLNLLVAFLILALWIFYIANGAKASGRVTPVSVTVHRGDTLWSIAENLAPGSDPRVVISRIKSINKLSSSSLVAGQKLKVGYLAVNE